jgi:peptidoglycan hydrolase CwlO-like protein
MKKVYILFLISSCIIFSSVPSIAQQAREEIAKELADGGPFFAGGASRVVISQRERPVAARPGMEVVRTGPNTEIVIPKGLKIYKDGAISVMETTSEYMVRRFLDVEKRLDEIEAKEEEFEKELKELKETVEGMQKNVSD